jgi:hypothetical protein
MGVFFFSFFFFLLMIMQFNSGFQQQLSWFHETPRERMENALKRDTTNRS